VTCTRAKLCQKRSGQSWTLNTGERPYGQTLLELRRLLERSHEAGEQTHLWIERDALGIEQNDSLLVDLRLIESASKQVECGIEALTGQAREELLAQLEQVTHLLRGPFLTGFTLRDSQFFDNWSSQHREYWHLRVYQIFDALSLLHEHGREVKRAIDTVNRWLRFDQLNEEGYRRLMRLHFSQGDRNGALRAYSRCRTVLAEELQVKLTPFTKEETQCFVQQIAWAEQPLKIEYKNSTSGSPASEQVSTTREALLPFTNWLYSQTHGQPLYLVETLKELMTCGIIFSALQDHGTWLLVLRPKVLAQMPVSELIPQTLRELIRAQLSPSAWTLLVTTSVLEEGLSFERLCQVAGLDELDGLRTLEELLHGRWLSEGTVFAESEVFDGYAFPCQMIREVVYLEAGTTRRRLMQRRLAAIIREGTADDQGEKVRSSYARALSRPQALSAPVSQRLPHQSRAKAMRPGRQSF
jgi:DNA-binding SARP family transcriptional activator